MNCPKCEGMLNIKEAEGHLGFNCEQCGGIWLSHKYIESLKHTYDFEPEKFLELLSTNQTPTKHICPSCSNNLYQTVVNSIELEWCHSCKGVWFDKTELSTLVEKYKNETTAGEAIAGGVDIIATALLVLNNFSA